MRPDLFAPDPPVAASIYDHSDVTTADAKAKVRFSEERRQYERLKSEYLAPYK